MTPLGIRSGKPAVHGLGRALLLTGLALAMVGSLFSAGCSSSPRRRHLARVEEAPTAVSLEAENEVRLSDGAGDDLAPLAADGAGLRRAAGLPVGQANPGGRPSEILRDLENKERLRFLEASNQARAGDRAFDEGDFQSAIDHYREALSLNPALPERVRERYNSAMKILGLRDGEIGDVKTTVGDGLAARMELHTVELERGLAEVKQLINDGEFDQAERNLAQLKDTFGYENYYSRDVSAEEREVANLLRRVGSLKIDSDRRKREELQAQAEADAEANRQRNARNRQAQVNELVSKAADYIRFKNYSKAVEACEDILRIDPHHKTAKWWLKLSRRHVLDQRRTKLIKDREYLMNEHDLSYLDARIPWVDPFTFPEEATWDEIKKRQAELEVAVADDPPAVQEIKNKLSSYRIDFIEFKEEPINQVVLQLQQLLGVNMRLDPNVEGVEDITVTLTLQNMRAADALDLILDHTGLAKTYRYEFLTITNAEGAKGDLTFHIYNVSDILNKIRDFPGPELRLKPSDEADSGGGDGGVSFDGGDIEEGTQINSEGIIDLIKNNTGNEEAWGADDYTIEFEKGLLLVNSPLEVHAQIRDVLANLRKDSDIFVMIEARFIDITDDFLEDIGVDYRNLGTTSNLGTPFGNIINDNRTGGNDLGFVKQGSPDKDTTLVKGQDRWAGRMQNIIDGVSGVITGDRLRGGVNSIAGLTLQSTWLDPFQLNAIFRAVAEKSDVRQLTAPTITAVNGERVYVSVITQRAYIADYELVSGGTGFSIIEVADPVVRTFQEGVILDVDPVISPDRKFITLDVRPTMATLIGGIISTILISLGSFTSVAFEVPIGVPQISLQQSFTSVTVPNGGTVLLGGFKSMNEAKYNSRVPFLGEIPLIKNLFRRKGGYTERRSLVLLITARIVNPRQEEARRFNEI